MQKEIHPQYYPEAEVHCACGNTFKVGAVFPKIQIETCNLCHPFFTGKHKFIDTAGRIDRFQAKLKIAESKGYDRAKKKAKQLKRKTKAPKIKLEPQA